VVSFESSEAFEAIVLAGDGYCVREISCLPASREILRPAKPRRIFYCPKIKGRPFLLLPIPTTFVLGLWPEFRPPQSPSTSAVAG
jgi:hypothetical protein